MSQNFVSKIKLKTIQGNQNIIINQQGDKKKNYLCQQKKIINQKFKHLRFLKPKKPK
jgi:hypothetical protein